MGAWSPTLLRHSSSIRLQNRVVCTVMRVIPTADPNPLIAHHLLCKVATACSSDQPFPAFHVSTSPCLSAPRPPFSPCTPHSPLTPAHTRISSSASPTSPFPACISSGCCCNAREAAQKTVKTALSTTERRRLMGLPKPLGPYAVAFADFELRRTEGVHGGIATGSMLQHNSPDFVMLADAQGAPLIRIFYPTSHANRGATPLSSASRWMPSIMYTWGYMSKLIRPSSTMHRLAIWILTGIVHSFIWPGVLIQASVATPILTSSDNGDEGRLPVVIFSHGLWACRTTYSAFCCDLASHGYIVVVPEHLDGSANMASYADHNGKRKWLRNTFADVPVNQITMHDRAKQLRQRVLEVRKVIDVLESLDRGLLTQNANTVTSKAALDVSMLQTRLDLHFIAVSGHSFGGATAIVASGIDKRIKCCVAMDVWWEPIDKMEFEKLAGKAPVLLLNTENFDWKALRDARSLFMKARKDATQDGRQLITVLKTIKGTSHQDQSDFTMLFPTIMKKMGVAGKMDPFLTKNVNSRACLDFLHKHLLPPGIGSPYAVDVVEDAEHLVVEY